MKLSAILLLIGVALLAYAFSIAPYKNEKLFMERYMAMSDGQSKEFWKLRDEMLTPKYQLQDYGGTVVAVAVGVFLVSRKGWRQIKSPKFRATLFWLAFVAPFLTVSAYVFDLMQGFDRGEFPHWADSMAIPLMGVPVLLVVLLVWSAAHLGFLRRDYQPATSLALAVSLKANWWLLFVSAVTALFVVACASSGEYWYAIPGVLWLYFYLSLGAVRRAQMPPNPPLQRDAPQAARP